MKDLKRKYDHLTKMARKYEADLDRATTPEEIGKALRMKRLYEDAMIALER